MPRSYTSLITHIVFSTHERHPFIARELRGPLHRYLGGIALNLGAHPLEFGGVADHVHLLATVPPALAVSEFVNKLKSNSCKWVHEALGVDFGWQRGYGAFSVSPSAEPSVKRYIANQEDHHRTVSFRDEFVRLLIDAGIDFDERYLFL